MSTSPVPAHEVLECASNAGAFAAPSLTVDRECVPHRYARQKAGLRPAVHKASAELRALRQRLFACSHSTKRYGVRRMTTLMPKPFR